MGQGRRIVFAGGGTGGHLFPGIAVAQELVRQEPSAQVVFFGSQRGIESDVLVPYGFEHVALPIEPTCSIVWQPLRFLWRSGTAYIKACHRIAQYRPDVVVGLGGFASVPIALAARHHRIPVVLLEQNVVPGRATSWLAQFAAVICLSFPETVQQFRFLKGRSASIAMRVTGNPVRSQIAELTAVRTRVSASKRSVLLVLGGSQGASALNAAVPESLRRLAERTGRLRVVHQTGSDQVKEVRRAYAGLPLNVTVASYLNDLPERYGGTTLAVSRAGATTLAELACAGIPAILAPYPRSVRDHQLHNARYYERAGGATVVEQGNQPTVLADRLTEALRELLDDRNRRQQMAQTMHNVAMPDAARTVVALIHRVASSTHRQAGHRAVPAGHLFRNANKAPVRRRG